MTNRTPTRSRLILVLSPIALIFLRAPSRNSKTLAHQPESRDWKEIPVTPHVLAVALELIAMSAVVVALAVEVFGQQALSWIPLTVGTSGLGFAIFGLVRLYHVYAWQQGILCRGSAGSFLVSPYGLLALSFALIMTLTLFAIGLLAAQATFSTQ